MEIYLLRHAIAVDLGTDGGRRDSDRRLSREGKARLRRIVEGMDALELSFDAIWSSPYRRARETAEIVAGAFKLRRQLKLTRFLQPAGDPRALIQEIKQATGLEKLLLVGHEPWLSEFAGRLIGGHGSNNIELKKGGLCLLRGEKLRYGRCATLCWLLTPRQLVTLAG